MRRHGHSLSHYKLLTCNMGELVPVTWFEALPGDTIRHGISSLLRATPLLAPVMHPVHVRFHAWFVPNRLIWDNWEDFITGGPDGNDATVRPYIQFANGTPALKTLADYLGIPTNGAGAAQNVSALPFRAYARIFNEWYRDQDIVTALVQSSADGQDTTTNTTLQKVAWEKDYFTTARPWPQKGDEITIPIGTDAPLVLDNSTSNSWLVRNTDGTLQGGGDLEASTAGGGNLRNKTGPVNSILDPNGRLVADLSSATGVSVNDLREALALQRFMEARARYGSRYTEYLRYLGVTSSDARLQRPEYLGGGRQTIQFSEVVQTGEGADPVGTLRGHGIGAVRSNRYQRFFEEHGIVMVLMSVLPKTMYGNGLHRSWSRDIKEDYYQKELETIGQQQVFKREVSFNDASPSGVWGYQDRYDEYRRIESGIAGDFRDTLDYWHMARIFPGNTSLNSSFIQADPTDRIYADTNEQELQVMVNHRVQALRLLSKRGNSLTF